MANKVLWKPLLQLKNWVLVWSERLLTIAMVAELALVLAGHCLNQTLINFIQCLMCERSSGLHAVSCGSLLALSAFLLRGNLCL